MALCLVKNFLRTSGSQCKFIPNITNSFSVKRSYASEADPEDYGYYPDPLEQASGREKKLMLARLAGDDRYEPKVYYRAEQTTPEYPNLIPMSQTERIVGCLCEADNEHINYFVLRKNCLRRCECGHWFKGINADPDFV